MDKLAEVFHFGPHSKSKSGQHKKIKGFVVLQKKNVLDFNDFSADILDDLSELIGKGVSFQLVSTSQIDSSGCCFPSFIINSILKPFCFFSFY
jgi:hypothetical protein